MNYKDCQVVGVRAEVAAEGDWTPTSVSVYIDAIDGDPYVVMRPENVVPWPDAERMARLEALLLRAHRAILAEHRGHGYEDCSTCSLLHDIDGALGKQCGWVHEDRADG